MHFISLYFFWSQLTMNYKGEIIDFNTNQILELKGYFPQNSPMKFSLSRKHMGNFS